MVKHDDYMTPFSAWEDVSAYIPRHLTGDKVLVEKSNFFRSYLFREAPHEPQDSMKVWIAFGVTALGLVLK